MSLRINSNIAAMNAYRSLASTNKEMNNSLQKLSSGLRINKAADDAAGLSISQGLQAQIGGLQVAARNAQDGSTIMDSQMWKGSTIGVDLSTAALGGMSLQQVSGGTTITGFDSAGLQTSTLDLTTTAGATAAINQLDTSISNVSTVRSNLGAFQNRFDHTINNLNVAIENLSASKSAITDTDMAQEMTNFTKAQILQQAGTAMLAQANQAPQGVLKLLG